MVKKALGMFTKEVGGIHDAAYLLGFFTILSQLLALFRDRLFAHYFGAGSTLDIYYAAFKIPDFIFVSIASFVSISVLVPLVLERIEKDKEGLHRFISSIFSFFLLVIVLVSVVVFIWTPALLKILLPGFAQGPHYADLVTLTRIMLLSPILLGVSNFFASITQSLKRFALYAISPILYNLGIISGIVFFYPIFGFPGLAYGVVFGAVLHFVAQVPFVFQTGLMPRMVSFRMSDIWQVSLVSFYRTAALSMSNAAMIVLSAIGSFMTAGSIAIFNLSWNMQSVPLAIVGVSYSLAIFPTISKHFSLGDKEKFVSDMAAAARHIIFWSLPITSLFIVLRAQIVRTILGSGAFSWSNTRLAAAALAVFSVSIVAQSLSLLFVRAYYASGSTRRPLLIDLMAAALIAVLGFLFWKLFEFAPFPRYFIESLFRVSDIPGTEILALPLAYSAGMIFNMVAFWYVFHKQYPLFSAPVLRAFYQSFAASVISGLVAYYGLNLLNHIFDINTGLGIFSQGLCAGLMGIVVGVLVLVVLNNRELKEVWITLHHKIWKAKVVGTDITEHIS